MGAHTFSQFGPGTDLEKVYRAAVDDALYEHGHDAYSGTISTTRGVTLRERGKVFTLAEALYFAHGGTRGNCPECGHLNARHVPAQFFRDDPDYRCTGEPDPQFSWRDGAPCSKRCAVKPVYARGDVDNANKWDNAFAVRVKDEKRDGFLLYGWAAS